jgi:hypothetical protein
MARCVWPFSIAALLAITLAGCSRFDHRERPAWRDQAEEACLAQHLVEATPYLQPSRAINGPSICGLNHPFRVYALAGGTVKLNTASLLDCSMIPALDAWIKDVVQPDAQARFGEPVVQIDTMGTYSCRGINNMSGAQLSEHAFANAMDVGGFVLASGREINVMRGWKSADLQESAFLHESHAGACTYFTTVLGPGANIFHYNHVHVDLAMHGNTSRGPRRYCKPAPDTFQVDAPRRDNLPDPPPIEEEQDMAQAPIPAPAYSAGGEGTLTAAVPGNGSSYRSRTTTYNRSAAPLSVVGMAPSPRVTAAPSLDNDAMAYNPAARRTTGDALDLNQAGGTGDSGSTDPDITSLIKHQQVQ